MHQSEFDVNTCNFWFWICLLVVEKVAQVLPSNRRTSLCKTEATANYSRFLFSCMWLLAVSFWAVESEPSSAQSDWREEKQKRSYRPSCNPLQLSCLRFQIPLRTLSACAERDRWQSSNCSQAWGFSLFQALDSLFTRSCGRFLSLSYRN